MPTPAGARRDRLSKNPDFVRLWWASGVSGLGARISREGLPLMAVLMLHPSYREIGLLAAIRAAPSLVVGLTCGDWVDRGRRRRILIATDLGRAGVLLVIPAAALTHHLVIAEIYAVAAIIGGLGSLFEMADHAYLPAVVDRDSLVRANAALGGVASVAEIGGPAVAGVLFAALTAPLALVANSLTYAVSAIILAGVKSVEPARAPLAHADRGLGRAAGRMLAGLRLAWASEVTRPLLLMVLTAGLFGSFFSALYIPYAVDTLRLTLPMLGLTIAVGGVGALGGAALAPWAARRIGLGAALIGSAILSALFNALIPLAGGSPVRAMAVLMVAQLFGDAVGTATYVYSDSLRQGLLAPGVLGRVAGVFAAAGGLAAIVGAPTGGWLGEVLGPRTAMLIACAGLAAAPLWCLASPLRRISSLEGPQGDEAAG